MAYYISPTAAKSRARQSNFRSSHGPISSTPAPLPPKQTKTITYASGSVATGGGISIAGGSVAIPPQTGIGFGVIKHDTQAAPEYEKITSQLTPVEGVEAFGSSLGAQYGERLLPPLSQGGGGVIRELHARESIPYGGRSKPTPTAAERAVAYEKGATDIFKREAQRRALIEQEKQIKAQGGRVLTTARTAGGSIGALIVHDPSGSIKSMTMGEGVGGEPLFVRSTVPSNYPEKHLKFLKPAKGTPLARTMIGDGTFVGRQDTWWKNVKEGKIQVRDIPGGQARVAGEVIGYDFGPGQQMSLAQPISYKNFESQIFSNRNNPILAGITISKPGKDMRQSIWSGIPLTSTTTTTSTSSYQKMGIVPTIMESSLNRLYETERMKWGLSDKEWANLGTVGRGALVWTQDKIPLVSTLLRDWKYSEAGKAAAKELEFTSELRKGFRQELSSVEEKRSKLTFPPTEYSKALDEYSFKLRSGVKDLSSYESKILEEKQFQNLGYKGIELDVMGLGYKANKGFYYDPWSKTAQSGIPLHVRMNRDVNRLVYGGLVGGGSALVAGSGASLLGRGVEATKFVTSGVVGTVVSTTSDPIITNITGSKTLGKAGAFTLGLGASVFTYGGMSRLQYGLTERFTNPVVTGNINTLNYLKGSGKYQTLFGRAKTKVTGGLGTSVGREVPRGSGGILPPSRVSYPLTYSSIWGKQQYGLTELRYWGVVGKDGKQLIQSTSEVQRKILPGVKATTREFKVSGRVQSMPYQRAGQTFEVKKFGSTFKGQASAGPASALKGFGKPMGYNLRTVADVERVVGRQTRVSVFGREFNLPMRSVPGVIKPARELTFMKQVGANKYTGIQSTVSRTGRGYIGKLKPVGRGVGAKQYDYRLEVSKISPTHVRAQWWQQRTGFPRKDFIDMGIGRKSLIKVEPDVAIGRIILGNKIKHLSANKQDFLLHEKMHRVSSIARTEDAFSRLPKSTKLDIGKTIRSDKEFGILDDTLYLAGPKSPDRFIHPPSPRSVNEFVSYKVGKHGTSWLSKEMTKQTSLGKFLKQTYSREGMLASSGKTMRQPLPSTGYISTGSMGPTTKINNVFDLYTVGKQAKSGGGLGTGTGTSIGGGGGLLRTMQMGGKQIKTTSITPSLDLGTTVSATGKVTQDVLSGVGGVTAQAPANILIDQRPQSMTSPTLMQLPKPPVAKQPLSFKTQVGKLQTMLKGSHGIEKITPKMSGFMDLKLTETPASVRPQQVGAGLTYMLKTQPRQLGLTQTPSLRQPQRSGSGIISILKSPTKNKQAQSIMQNVAQPTTQSISYVFKTPPARTMQAPNFMFNPPRPPGIPGFPLNFGLREGGKKKKKKRGKKKGSQRNPLGNPFSKRAQRKMKSLFGGRR